MSFKTRDQQIGSLLCAVGQKLKSSTWTDGICWFSFENEESCENTVKKYYAGEITVNARTLFESLNTIKRILYSKK